MNKMTSYILCNKSDMCKEILDTLPNTYNEHFSTLWTEEHYEDEDEDNRPTLHPTVSQAVRSRAKRIQEKPDGYHPPSVMFYDSATDKYIHHEGSKAVQFLHNYVQAHHTNRINRQQQHVNTHSPKLSHSNNNLQKILDITTQTKSMISPELKNIIQSNTKQQLQYLYSSIHKTHIPMKK
jgi:hypothetical protein